MRTKIYQQLVGSLAFISTNTRVDVARAHSVLGQHLQNPGQKHLNSAYHVWRYLLGKRELAIEADGSIQPSQNGLLFYGASDAAFADDRTSRRSSYGYLFMLYGMPIDWKASLQRSVTKSTTEAELLALSTAATELLAWNRLFKHLRVDLELSPTLYCDNQQTVGIITKIDEKLHTKLRHVDIHQHWLRQEVQRGNIQIEWKPTNQMPADGLTKSLARQRHASFMQQLGLRDIKDYLSGGDQIEGVPDPGQLQGWY